MSNDSLLTMGGHLEALRRMLFRICLVLISFSAIIFVFKNTTWELLLAPSKDSFVTYRILEDFCSICGFDFIFEPFKIDLISTELSAQFIAHLSTALYIGLIFSSPYILYELFKYISPALYDNERKCSVKLVFIIYLLFIIGVLMSYFILFPIAFRFLGTYSVAEEIHSTITLDSYVSTFATLTFMLGLVFQLPVVAFFLAKMSLINHALLIEYRKWAFIIILLIAAIISPPDLLTLFLVGLPMYLLYEISICVVRQVNSHKSS